MPMAGLPMAAIPYTDSKTAVVMAYDMILRREPYRDAGADFFDRLQPEDTARRLIKRLESLGYHVTLQNPSPDAMS